METFESPLSKIAAFFIVFSMPCMGFGQNYTSYFTGDTTNLVTNPSGGVCLMGGATEDDNAMKWFLNRADGGDILVLRTSGSDGYNDYLYSSLGISVNSVESIVCNNAAASYDPYVLQKIQQAEAVWFAGGDQWKYVSYWRSTPVDSLVNQAIQQRNIVVGGTSAGMAILGKYYFSAQNGTVTSATALANPFNNHVTVDSTSFIQNAYLSNVITDTHFDNPDRRGRLVTFLARIYTDFGVLGKALACDEYTAICIDTTGIAQVFGGYPPYNDNAYFIQTNCGLPSQAPETCAAGSPLSWDLGGKAIKVYRIRGTPSGINTFDLNDWETGGSGGQWFNWSVTNGVFSEQNGNPINCNPVSIYENQENELSVFPNPTSGKVIISSAENSITDCRLSLCSNLGRPMRIPENRPSDNLMELDLGSLPFGLYFLTIISDDEIKYCRMIIKN